RIEGKSPSGSAPERVNSSVWHTPVALISTSTSPARGPASWTVSMERGAPAFRATAARTSICILPAEGAAFDAAVGRIGLVFVLRSAILLRFTKKSRGDRQLMNRPKLHISWA